MQCPECGSEHVRKNGHRRGKPNHLCVECRHQFVANPQTEFGYSDEVRQQCLKLYTNGLGLRAIERVSGVHHTTVINNPRNCRSACRNNNGFRVVCAVASALPSQNWWMRICQACQRRVQTDSCNAGNSIQKSTESVSLVGAPKSCPTSPLIGNA